MHNAGFPSTLCLALVVVPLVASVVASPSDFLEEAPLAAEIPDKRGWANFQSGYGKRGWNSFAGGYGKRAIIDAADYEEYAPDSSVDAAADYNSLDAEKRAWNSGFAGGVGKRAWNSGFAGGIGKRAWNGFAGGYGKRGWNSFAAGGYGKRAWNGFAGGYGKRSAELPEEYGAEGKNDYLEYEDEHKTPSATSQRVTKLISEKKRGWLDGVGAAWGKRSNGNHNNNQKYILLSPEQIQNMLDNSISKRTKGWLALRGMWG